VDKNNGELRVANTIDRESHFVQDGIYNITMRAVDASEFLVNDAHRSTLFIMRAKEHAEGGI